MHETIYVTTIVFMLFLVSAITRAVPFVFSKLLVDNQNIKTIGTYLPGYIMLLLTIYEVKITSFTEYPYGIPALIALAILTVVHVWKRNMLISLAFSLVAYIFMGIIFAHGLL